MAACLVLLFTRASVAAVVYVNKNAIGATPDGLSWSTAFRTVQEGVNVALSGDEVWVAASAPAAPAYVENILLFKGVALYGGFAGTESGRTQRDWKTNVTVLDGNQKDAVVTAPWDAVVDGFTIRNGHAASYGGGIYAGASGTGGPAIITNDTITGNSTPGYGGGIYVSSGTANITNNAITANVGGGIIAYGAATVANNIVASNSTFGIYVYGDTATITNNIIAGNGTGSGGGGIMAYGSTAIKNDTITGNSGAGAIYMFGTVSITNTIVAFNNSPGIYRFSGTVALSHNGVYDNAGDYTGVTDPMWTNGNIPLDPVFANASAKDYHLLPGSHCIDTGDDSVIAAGERDADGHLRIIGARVDIGAYEYGVTNTYTLPDAVSALSVMGGLSAATPSNFAHLNADRGGTSANLVDMYDVVWIARRAVGLDPE
jgi:hypothetical protein